MTLPGLDTTATWAYQSTGELVDILHRRDFERVVRNLDSLSPARFVERFEELVAELHAPVSPT